MFINNIFWKNTIGVLIFTCLVSFQISNAQSSNLDPKMDPIELEEQNTTTEEQIKSDQKTVAVDVFRYNQNVPMDEKQTHYYNVILSDETTADAFLFEFDFESLSASELIITLPDGETIRTGKSIMPNSSYGSRTMWVGRFGSNGEIHLAPHFDKKMLTGHLHTDSKTYSIRSLTGGLQVLIEYDDHGLETCGNHNLKTDRNAPIPTEPYIPTQEDEINLQNSSNEESMSVVLNDECYIRVLVGYTSTVASNEADPLGLIMTAISLANTGYANSGIDQEIQLVRVYNTGYDDTGQVQGDVLDLWKDNNDGVMDHVHVLRNLVAADMCALITNIGSGIAFVSPTEALAFSLTRRTRVSGFTFHHELGHNHGCFHDPPNNSAGPSSNYQGFGNPNGIFRTVMAYECPGGTACPRVNEFSGTTNTYTTGGTTYATGNANQNNVLGHNTNNGTVVNHRVIPNALSYDNPYDFEEFEFANFSAKIYAKYSSNANQMIYQDGSEGSFSAGDSIILGRGFEVKAGAKFTAYLEPSCTPITLTGNDPVVALIDDKDPSEIEVQKFKMRAEENHEHKGTLQLSVSPNPFDVSTNIKYTVGISSKTELALYDIFGKKLQVLKSAQLEAGEYTHVLNAQNLSAGTFYCVLENEGERKVQKIVLIK